MRTPLTPRAAAAALALLVACGGARAHDVSYAHVELRWTASRLDGALTVHPDDAAMVLSVPMPEWFKREDFLARAAPALADSLRQKLLLRADGRPLAWEFQRARVDPGGRGVQLMFTVALPRPPAALEVEGPVFPGVANHETFVNVFRDSVLIQQSVLTLEHRVTHIYGSGPAGVAAVLRTFVPAGIHHIAIGPDHILFVLGLLLLGGGLVRLLKIVTSFTIAHSITLALASLGLVRLPSRIVEPLIALSIVFVAFETLRAHGGAVRTHDRRASLAFAFGLIHGFGFASVLAEFGLPREALGWSLAGFNVGVEIGQAVIVLLVAPALAWVARRSPSVHMRMTRALAYAIAAAGAFWFVQRLIAKG